MRQLTDTERLAQVRHELAIIMGKIPEGTPFPIQEEPMRLVPGREVILFERSATFDREVPRRETFNEGEKLSPTLRRTHERGG